MIAHADDTISFYVNGQLSGTPNQTGDGLANITTTNPLTIGNRSTATDRTFDGNLAELGIISLEGRGDLTAQEISNLYRFGSLVENTAHFFPLSELPSTYLDTVGGATGTGTATTYSTDVPTQLPVVIDTEARSSLSFDGVDDYVDLNTNLNNELNGTQALWLDVEFTMISFKNPTSNAIIRGGAGGVNNIYLYARQDGGLGYSVSTDGTNATIETTTSYGNVRIGSPTRVSLVYDGSLVSVYSKGQLIAQQVKTGNIALGTANFILGSRTAGSHWANTYIKSLRIWNKVPTLQEIKNLHFANIVPRDTSDNLLIDYKLNEGAGTIAYDSSGNGNDGTITGATWSAAVPSKAREVIGGNLVKNGDFSYVPRVNVATTTSLRWIDGTAGGSTTNDLFKWHYVNDAGTTSAQFDSTEKYSGGFSIKIDATDASGRGRVIYGSTNGTSASLSASMLKQYAIPVKPNTSYTLSYWAKSLNLAGNGRISVHQHTGGGTRLGITQPAGNLTGTNDWTLLSGQFTTQATAKYLVFSCEIATAGIQTLWFSDISLTETTLPTRTATTTRTTLTCP